MKIEDLAAAIEDCEEIAKKLYGKDEVCFDCGKPLTEEKCVSDVARLTDNAHNVRTIPYFRWLLLQAIASTDDYFLFFKNLV